MHASLPLSPSHYLTRFAQRVRPLLGSRASHPRKTRPTNGYLLSVATRADSYEEWVYLYLDTNVHDMQRISGYRYTQ